MNIILLGAPGSGKGTQAVRIAKDNNLKWLSTGDLLREAANKKDEFGLKISSILKSGSLVSDDIIIEMLNNTIAEILTTYNGIVFDGFPRTILQAKELDLLMDKLAKKIDLVIEINVSKEFLIERIANRFFCGNCKQVYNKLFNKPKNDNICDVCGSTSFFTREDDVADTVETRYECYLKETKPLIEFYNKKNILKTVDGTKNISEVNKQIDLLLK